MADNWTLKDSGGSTITNSAKDEGGGVMSSRVTPRVGGSDVSSGNPLPVQLVAGTAIAGKTGIDQTTDGTTNHVHADIAEVAGSAIAQGHGTAATAIRVELPTDGTGVVGLIAGTAIVGKFGIDQTTDGTTNRVNANIAQVAGSAISQGHGTAATAIRVELPTDGTGIVGLATGSNIVGKFTIDQTTPGTTNAVQANAKRNSGTLHRNAITSADVLAGGGTVTLSNITESGSNLTNALKYATIVPYNRWGPSAASSIQSTTPTANQAVRIAFAQVTGADGYDVFLSGSTPPAWVGRITEAQRATGDQIISAVGVVSARGSTTAGTIDVGIVGTGLVSNVAPFATNNAFTPASITPVNCAGYKTARCLVKLAVTDLRSLPALTLVPFFANQTSGSDWHQGQAISLPILGAIGQTLEWDISLDVDGSTGLAIAVGSISGQGAAASVWVELS